MPEGDSIRRIADRLAPLVGKTIERATTQGLVRAIEGRTVTAITSHGKHLLIDLDDATQLRIHLGMTGRFRQYTRAAGEAIVRGTSPGRASLVLVTADAVYLGRATRTVEITARRAPMRGRAVGALGPDILAGDFDGRQLAMRATVHDSRTIADILLDQRVAAGIGNIWKSESLFACGIDPRTRARDLSAAQLEAIYGAARSLMQASTAGHRAFAVYSRTGRPCVRCGTAISAYLLGDPPRWTWSCVRCQPGSPPAR